MQYPGMPDDASGSPREYQDFSPSVDNQLLSRKRTYSMSEGLSNAFMHPSFGPGARPSSVGGWPVQNPARESANVGVSEGMAALDAYASAGAANAAAKTSQPFWSEGEGALADQQSRMEGVIDGQALTIDEKVLDVLVYSYLLYHVFKFY